MAYPERFSELPAYAFPRLRGLLSGHAPGVEPVITLSIGEPRQAVPAFVGEVLAANMDGFGRYPPNEGTPEALAAICGWLGRRYGVTMAPDEVCLVNGTREALYNAAMALCPETRRGGRPAVLMPNPFYQVYSAAALSVGAEPIYVPATEETGFLPDYAALPAEVLGRVALAYICSPANPQGAVAGRDYWRALIALAERHDFTILADECYSEIYRDAPPPGILEIAAEMGADPERVVSFHSLSKRSGLPGLRTGFVATGRQNMARIRQLRAYAGAPVPGPLQAVAAKAWGDEAHVEAGRALYVEKYADADRILGNLPGYAAPQAGLFLWIRTGDGEASALKLWQEAGLMVLPGAYLGREVGGINPGAGYIRVAMVAPRTEMQDGLKRLRACLDG